MSSNTFLHIHSFLRFYPDEENIPVKRQGSLWHSRNILNHFLQNASSIDVSDGPVALDENIDRTKAKNQAKSYIPSKPVKFGIRFYSVVGLKYTYLYILWNNESGNRTTMNDSRNQLLANFKLYYDNLEPERKNYCIENALSPPSKRNETDEFE